MDYKKLSTIIFMVSGVATVVWGMLANDWSKCWGRDVRRERQKINLQFSGLLSAEKHL